MKPGKRLKPGDRVRFGESSDRACLLGVLDATVKDKGEGVPEKRREFLFKRFDQVDVGAAAEGHGIGLSVVATLVRRFGGRVWVEDRETTEEIKGSVFSVILPQAPHAQNA